MSAKKMLTLNDTSSEEVEKFKPLIELEKVFLLFSRRKLKVTNTHDVAERIADTHSQDSSKDVLKWTMQRLFDTSARIKEKRQLSLSQRVKTIQSAIELLLETLKDLSYTELERFKEILSQICFPRHSDVPWWVLDAADTQDTVFLMVQSDCQQSVEKTREVLERMKRTDLVQRLSDGSSGTKKKHPMDEHQSALIHKVATMTAVKKLLLETLNDLSDEERKDFMWLLQFSFFQRSLPDIPGGRPQMADNAELLVDVVVGTCGEQSVEVTKEVFTDMNRADLVQRLSETSSGPKAAGSSDGASGKKNTEEEKHSVAEHWPALTQKVETMVSAIELLLETLKDVSDAEFKMFKHNLQRQLHFHRRFLNTPMMLLETTDMQDTVFFLVQSYGQMSVEKIKDILEKMKKSDLVQRLSVGGSRPKKKQSADEHHSVLKQKVATIAAVQQLLLETLNDLSDEDLEKFSESLQSIVSQTVFKDISWMLTAVADRADMVDLMVQTYGQQSVEFTREVFMDMKKTDLVMRLSKPSSGHREKCNVDKHQPAPSQREASKAAVEKILLEALKDLDYTEFKKFKLLLPFTYFRRSLPQIPGTQLDWATRADLLVDLMVENQQSVEVAKEVLMEMNRTDVVKRLSESSSELKGPSRSSEPQGCESNMDSSGWTKLEPEVDSTDADEAQTYSLESGAGHFECCVSGLRWACKNKVSLQYQFCPFEEVMERMERIRYVLAGPLMDIKVNAGKLDEVYLPHWINIVDSPTIREQFAVLHIDDCGDVVEKVSEVTSSHVKLPEPLFSPRAVLMRAGAPVKINCNVLIYKTNTAFLTLHVYLIPCDPGLHQAMDKRQSSYGYKVIRKPHPEKSLKMRDRFILTADMGDAKIYPENLKLRYESRFPNFFEVYIENPVRNFTLNLTQKNESQPVWTSEIRKEEYQSAEHIQGEHFVDKHQFDLIERVRNIGPVLDNLLREGVIQQEDYDTIRMIPTTQEKMRKLYSGPLKAGGQAAKDVFYKILEEKESYLVSDLKRRESQVL